MGVIECRMTWSLLRLLVQLNIVDVECIIDDASSNGWGEWFSRVEEE